MAPSGFYFYCVALRRFGTFFDLNLSFNVLHNSFWPVHNKNLIVVHSKITFAPYLRFSVSPEPTTTLPTWNYENYQVFILDLKV